MPVCRWETQGQAERGLLSVDNIEAKTESIYKKAWLSDERQAMEDTADAAEIPLS